MIYTVTFNPSLDYIVKVQDFTLGQVNRTEQEIIFPGGKGINVSLVLKNLGVESTILGFISGFTGAEIRRRLHSLGCREELLTLDLGLSRINVKLRSKEESEINGQGPDIDAEAIRRLFEQLDALQSEDMLVLAGSIPGTMPDSIYRDIMEHMENKGIPVVIDATKDLLINTLKYHPFLIKPNNIELGEIFQVTIKDKNDVALYGRKLQEMGARNVLVSMAGDGAVLISEEGRVYESAAPKGTLVNSVGAGDSMVAGFLAGYLAEHDYEHAFRMGVAAGSASAFSENLAARSEVEELLSLLLRGENE